jgi:hypothetical protein
MRDTLSKLAEGSYAMGKKNAKVVDKVAAANEKAHGTDYVVIPKHSNADITTYHHKDNPKNIVIAHRGTDVGGRHGKRDIQNDLAFAVGVGGHEGRFKRRKNRTEKIIKSLHKEHGGIDELHLTGHSLGGGTMNHTIANSKLVQKHLTSGHSFNSASNPVFSNGTSVSKKTKAVLDKKVVHHRIEHDVVSAGFKTNTPFGKVKTYKLKKESDSKTKSIFKSIIGMHPLIKMKRMSEKSLNAHSLSNFTEHKT